MSYDRRPSPNAFPLSVIAGSLAGVFLTFVVVGWYEPIPRDELWAIPLLLVGYGAFAMPFVALGLAIFGLPATALLRKHWNKWWIGILAVAWGAFSGKLMWYALDHLLFFGESDSNILTDPGVLWGVPTAVAWWVLRRHEIARYI